MRNTRLKVLEVFMRVHPAAEYFPDIEGPDFDALVEDIKVCGLRDPITVTEDMILDGRHRYRACERLGIPVKSVEWDKIGSPQAFVASKNLYRRHLNETQRAWIGAQMANKEKGWQHQWNNCSITQESGKNQEVMPGLSRVDAAKIMNVSPLSISRAKIVLKEGTEEEKLAMADGTMAASTAAKRVRARRKKSSLPPTRPGPMIAAPDSMMAMADQILALNNSGNSIISICGNLRISQDSCRAMRDIAFLASRSDLPESSVSVIQEAIVVMNRDKQVAKASAMLEGIMAMILGPKEARKAPPDKWERRRNEIFEQSYGYLSNVLSSCDQIDIPYMSKDRSIQIARDLNRGIASVSALRKRIMEVHKL